jgi:AcrR family transcriptional regulator
MSRMPVAQRREQLVEAALRVASRDGIDAATVRAVAAEAGVSLGVVHYCFLDKDELMRAVAAAITDQNLAAVDNREQSADLPSLLEEAIASFWRGVTGNRGAQLLSYELTTTSLRHAELSQVAIAQYHGSWHAFEVFLERTEHSAGIEWMVPRRQLARTAVAIIDGFALAWLVDGDDKSAREGMAGFARFLQTQAIPLGACESTSDPRALVESAAQPA